MSRLISDLDKRFQPFVTKLLDEFNSLNNNGWKAFITDGRRTQAEQDRLYAKGRTEPGNIVTWTRKSNHIKGLAVDIAFQKAGKLSYSVYYYAKLVKIARKLGFECGVDWKIKDRPHFQMLKFGKIPPAPIEPTMDIRLKLLDEAGIKTEGDLRGILGAAKDIKALKIDKDNLQSKYDELARNHESVKKDFTTEVAVQKQIAQDRKEEYKRLISEVAKELGVPQEKAVIVAEIKRLVAENDKAKDKEDLRPIAPNSLQSLIKLLKGFFTKADKLVN